MILIEVSFDRLYIRKRNILRPISWLSSKMGGVFRHELRSSYWFYCIIHYLFERSMDGLISWLILMIHIPKKIWIDISFLPYWLFSGLILILAWVYGIGIEAWMVLSFLRGVLCFNNFSCKIFLEKSSCMQLEVVSVYTLRDFGRGIMREVIFVHFVQNVILVMDWKYWSHQGSSNHYHQARYRELF